MKNNIVLLSSTCSSKHYEYLQSIKTKEKINPSQKYFYMLIKGLNFIDECEVTCVSIRSIDPSNCNLKKLDYYEDEENGIKFIYPPIVNEKIFKHSRNIKNVKSICKEIIDRNLNKGVNTIFLFDALCFDACYGGLLAGKKIKKCAVVTDIPTDIVNIGKGVRYSLLNRLKARIHNQLFRKYDCFCFLVESMNVINKKDKPFVLIEGMIDKDVKNPLPNVHNKIVLYAGGIYEKFGLKKLVSASKLVDIPGFELHIYGEGNLVSYITEIEKVDERIKYLGCLSLSDLFEKEREACLLINTRPTNERFTKYSFPSKTLEYMSTGRPVMSTKLAGIPSQYFEYLICIEDESEEGIKKALLSFFNRNTEEINEIGQKTFDYVVKEKNNVKQAMILWEMLQIRD